jgi:hypothetical protein
MKNLMLVLIVTTVLSHGCGTHSQQSDIKARNSNSAQNKDDNMKMEMTVKKIDSDFEVTGDGSAPAWNQTEWQPLSRVNGETTYQSRIKVLYSDTGIYFLADCEDNKLTCTMTEDFDNIFKEDVIEVFLWTLQDENLYFEYEISPLEVELPILVANHEPTGFQGWRPWHYEGNRKTRKATSVRGGKKESMAEVDGWSAEFFIPFALLKGVGNVPPESGTIWRANMYRIDYDSGTTQWAWETDAGSNFHNFREFGTFVFE